MSAENVEIVRRGFQAFNDGDLDAALANFADDVEWRLIGGFAALMGAEFKGRDAVRRFSTSCGRTFPAEPTWKASSKLTIRS